MGDDYRYKKGNSPGLSPMNSYTFSLPSINTGGGLTAGTSYRYLTGIVKEVISNPEEFLARPYINNDTGAPIKDESGNSITVRQVLSGEKDVGMVMINNNYFIDHIPINTVIAHITDYNNNTDTGTNVLCFPFFPPHLSLPIKPGEYVWIIKEDVKGNDIFYWMCRKVGIRQLDDINLTHFERHDNLIDAYEEYRRTSEKVEGTGVNTLANFYTPTQTNLEPGESFDEIAALSIAFKEEFTGEPVPRQIKDCSDLLIQGSNNAHIMLGTEKFNKHFLSPEIESIEPSFHAGKAKDEITGNRKPLSPAIDICIGRKYEDIFNLKDHTVNSAIFGPVQGPSNFTAEGNDIDIILGAREDHTHDMTHMEVDKTVEVQGKEPKLNEYHDIDARNCMSRLYMSNNSHIDGIFSIGYTAEGEAGAHPADIKGINDYSCLVAYSANTRIVGRETVKIDGPGGSLISFTHAGDIILQNSSGAKIVLDNSGDIKIVPGSDGKVYLGGEKDAAKIKPVGTGGVASVSSDSDATAEAALDAIDGIGNIVTSAAGLIVEPAGSGRLSKKVRMR